MPDKFWTPARKESLRQMVAQGTTDIDIAKALNCARATIRHQRVAMGLKGIDPDALRGVDIILPAEVAEYFSVAAPRYDTSPKALVIRVLTVIASDDLVNSIIDVDGGLK